MGPRRPTTARTPVIRPARIDDPLARPLLDELRREYTERYGPIGESELSAVPDHHFAPPHGLLLLLMEGERPVAGGAFRRHDANTAEVKRMWTASDSRRRGHARRVLAALERAAADAGYTRMHLTTGPRQPEARALYLAAGYTARFDLTADPETIGPLAFDKELPPAPERVPARDRERDHGWDPERAPAQAPEPWEAALTADPAARADACVVPWIGGLDR
ncbi:GNAT family N-acetyltransferase [Nocardiopsis protaetiae]|uniref:GNAT family N-acetyltransferase n=1 Tax=Nocardiopsis protaetiae TaxID=3382270 RepID=UPI00387ACB74